MNKKIPMTNIPPLANPLNVNGEIYNPDGYKNCCQIEFNKDGTVDVYDYNTKKHLMSI